MIKASNTKLPNGLTYVSVPFMSGAAIVTLLVKTGSRYETIKESGISHLLEHYLCGWLMQTWRQDYPNKAHLIDDLNAGTNRDNIIFNIMIPANSAELIAVHLGSILSSLKIDETLLNSERARAVAEMKADHDLETRMYQRMLNRHYYHDSPVGYDCGGQAKVLETLTAAQLQDWHEQYIVPERTILQVVGPKISNTQLQRLGTIPQASTLTGKLKQPVLFRPIITQSARDAYKSRVASVIWIGYCPGTVDLAAMAVVTHVINKLARDPLTAAGHTYSVSRSNDNAEDYCDISLEAEMEPQMVEGFLRQLAICLKNVSGNLNNANNVKRWREVVADYLLLDEHDPWSQAGTAIMYQRLTGQAKSVDQDCKLIREVSIDAVIKLWSEIEKNQTLLVGGKLPPDLDAQSEKAHTKKQEDA